MADDSVTVDLVARDGRVLVSSVDIASRFGKQHSHVIRAIEKLECSQGFRRSNFGPSNYLDSQGKRQPSFLITRDGFAFLAMGFTGTAAARWKERFLEAFNLMETEIRSQRDGTAAALKSVDQLAIHRVETGLQVVQQKSDTQIQMLTSIDAKVDQVRNTLPSALKRRDFSENTRARARKCRHEHYNDRCPCCGSKAEAFENDHWDGVSSNYSRGNCIQLCKHCHTRKNKDATAFREQYKAEFSTWATRLENTRVDGVNRATVLRGRGSQSLQHPGGKSAGTRRCELTPSLFKMKK